MLITAGVLIAAAAAVALLPLQLGAGALLLAALPLRERLSGWALAAGLVGALGLGLGVRGACEADEGLCVGGYCTTLSIEEPEDDVPAR